MRAAPSNTSRRFGFALVLAAIGCTHDRSSDYQGTLSVGSIGSAPVSDDDSTGGDDESSSSDDGASDGTPVTSGTSASTSATGAPTDDGATGPSTTASSDTGSGDPVLDGCLEIAVNECETCACNLCLDPLYACQQDVGCVAMRDCAEQAGCAGVDCLEPCGAVIDMHGGPFGSSGELALTLSDCLSASCPACF
jgi:hypothetical protein